MDSKFIIILPILGIKAEISKKKNANESVKLVSVK